MADVQPVINGLRTDLQAYLTDSINVTGAKQCEAMLKKLFHYTTDKNNCDSTQLTLKIFRTLKPNASDEEFKTAVKAAFSAELLQKSFILTSEVVYVKQPEAGTPPSVDQASIMDGLILSCVGDYMLNESLADHPQEVKIIESVNYVKARTTLGYIMDMTKVKPEEFTWELYDDIVKYKTMDNICYFPLELGFYLADKTVDVDALKDIAYKLSYLYQAQNDYLNVLGDGETVTGTDIARNRCTWVTCTLLDKIRDDKSKYELFTKHFGSEDPEDIAAVKKLAAEETLKDAFAKFQKKSVEEIREKVDAFPTKEVHPILLELLETIANRV